MNYDIHISAEKISTPTIEALERIGFVRDEFTNNRRCNTAAYHATYFRHLEQRDDDLWNVTIEALKSDTTFRGCLEEECFDASSTNAIGQMNSNAKFHFVPLKFKVVRVGSHKACDIHMNIDCAASTSEALREIERLQMISFDRPVESGFNRIFTVTLGNVKIGIQVFARLSALANSVPGLSGKIKFETISRFYVSPKNATQLPIVPLDFAVEWLQITNGEAHV